MTSGALNGGQVRAARLRAARRLAYDCTLAEVIDALAERDVTPLLLKGLAFARWLYDEPDERPDGDIDLLVAPNQFAAGRLALGKLGFRKGPAGTHAHEEKYHEVWIRGGPLPGVVELHRTLFFLAEPPALVWERLSAGAQTIVVAGAEVSVPGAAASALIAALHAIHHGVGYQKPQRDLERAVARVDVETWRAAQVLAEELGVELPFAAGLRLAPGGLALSQQLGLPDVTGSRYFRLLAITAPDGATGIERLVTTRGLGARLKLLALELVPSPGFMHRWYPVARRGRRGLATAYVGRPFHLVMKLPGGLRGWLDAGRQPPQRWPGD
jgi:hypothetical protein